jgi:hypothetical protein
LLKRNGGSGERDTTMRQLAVDFIVLALLPPCLGEQITLMKTSYDLGRQPRFFGSAPKQLSNKASFGPIPGTLLLFPLNYSPSALIRNVPVWAWYGGAWT